jgi:predicted MFS family arabinose efflux permease
MRRTTLVDEVPLRAGTRRSDLTGRGAAPVRRRGRLSSPIFVAWRDVRARRDPPHAGCALPDLVEGAMPSSTARPAAASAARQSTRLVMLLALTCGFALSQAFRTVAALMAPLLQAEFGATPEQLGVFAGTFHFAFGAMQVLVGIGIDLHGIRRTVLAAFPLAIVGSLLAAFAPRFEWLVLGQALIGIGCAPAFLVCTVFVARRYPPERFAAVSGLVLGVGSVGMLATGSPLAWLIETWSWRAGFVVLAACSVAAWLAIWWTVAEPPLDAPAPEQETIASALRRFGALFTLPHTAGIVALAAVTYASFITLRGLWLGPLLIERHGFTLLEAGHVALAVSLVAMLGPPLFGRLDPGPATRRRWLVGGTLVIAALLGLIAAGLGAAADVALSIAFGLLSGYMVLQYADVRAAYPAAMTGRALALLTMAMFLGVAAMQWATGWVGTLAPALRLAPYVAVPASMALLLLAGAAAYAGLPAPPARREG